MDKLDRGNRIEQMMKGVNKKDWTQDPVMTLIGPLPTPFFLRYLTKMTALQAEIARYGRIRMYVFMRPEDYITYTAGPHLNLHTYQKKSVLFNLFYNWKYLGKYERKRFLPWQTHKPITKWTQYVS